MISMAQKCSISIHAPREGGDQPVIQLAELLTKISIHAPREGGDFKSRPQIPRSPKFQSTPPARGATLPAVQMYHLMDISIHAPREGGDRGEGTNSVDDGLFQSTPPARGATMTSAWWPWMHSFQSTPPARGATY